MGLPKIYAGRRRRLLGLLIANGVAQALCGFALAYLLRETLATSREHNSPWPGAVCIASLGLLTLYLRLREASDAERLGQNYVTRVRLRIFDRLASRPARDATGGRWGVSMTRLIGDLNSLRNWVSTGIARAIVAGISVVGLLAGLTVISPWSGLSVGAMILCCAVAAKAITPPLRERIRESRQRRGRLANNLGEKILALRTVSQLGREAQERARVRRHSVRLTDALVRRASMGSALRSLPDVTLPLAIAGIAVAASISSQVASESVVSVLLLGMIAASLRDLARAWDHRLAFEEGHRRISSILSGSRITESRSAVGLPQGRALSLDYEAVRITGVLEGLNAQFDAGEQVLVTGPSGSGKSSMLALATRMFDPDAGEVRLQGHPLPSLRLDSLRSSVQRVSPDMPLLRGTVAENIGYGLVDSESIWVERVIEACGLRQETSLLPEGLASPVDEQGRNLPDGLRARVALARAAALAPGVLLVDDLTFLTDPEAASALRAVRDIGGFTCLVVGTADSDPSDYDRVWEFPKDTPATTEVDFGVEPVRRDEPLVRQFNGSASAKLPRSRESSR